MENGIKMPETTREELESSFDAFYRDNKKLNDVVDDLIGRLDKSIKKYVESGESRFYLRYYVIACKDMSYDERYVYIHHYIEKYIKSLGMEMSNYTLHSDELKVDIHTKFKVFKPEVAPIIEEIAPIVEVKEQTSFNEMDPVNHNTNSSSEWGWFYVGIIFMILAAYVFENYTIVAK